MQLLDTIDEIFRYLFYKGFYALRVKPGKVETA